MTAQDHSFLLVTTSLKGYVPSGVAERPAYKAYAQIADLTAAHCGKEAAAFFAQPVYRASGAEIDWYATIDGKADRYDALPADEREKVLEQAERILLRLSEFSASVGKGDVKGDEVYGALMEKALHIPDVSSIWRVGDYVVVAPWGMQKDNTVRALSLREFIERERRRPPPPAAPEPAAAPPEPAPEPAPPQTAPEAPPAKKTPWALWLAGAAALAGAIVVALLLWPRPPAPVAVDDVAHARHGASVVVDVLANDRPGGPVVLALAAPPANGAAEIVDGSSLRYTPKPGYAGPDSLRYSIKNSRGESSAANVAITVAAPENTPPVARPDRSEGIQHGAGQIIDVLANDDDADGDAITISGVESPRNGTAVVLDGRILYRPFLGFSGEESFKYTIKDARGATGEASATVATPPAKPGDRLVAPQCGREKSPESLIKGCWRTDDHTWSRLDKDGNSIPGTGGEAYQVLCFNDGGKGKITINKKDDSSCTAATNFKIDGGNCSIHIDVPKKINCSDSTYFIASSVVCSPESNLGFAMCKFGGGSFSTPFYRQ